MSRVDTKISAMNLAMAAVLRDAEPKSVSRRAAAARMSITEGQLHRLLGGNPDSIRDVNITTLEELARVWGIELTDLVKQAEDRVPEFEEQSRKLAEALSDARRRKEPSDDDFEFDANVKPSDFGLASNEGERKIDRGVSDDGDQSDETGGNSGSAGAR